MKFSDERNFENSVKTIILENENKRTVIKCPIYNQGLEHIIQMYKKEKLLHKGFPNIKLTDMKINNNSLQCEYINGECLTNFYQQCIENRDREALLKVISNHIDIIKGIKENQCQFHETEQSKKIFGDLSYCEGREALRITNFEASANNIIISKNGVYFIDYEWVFDFAVPLDIVLYHCVIWTSYANIPQLSKIIAMEELIKYMRIDTEVYKNHIHFINLITKDYYLGKKGYEKEIYNINEIDKQWKKKEEQQQAYLMILEEGQKRQTAYISNLERDLQSQNEYVKEMDEVQKRQQTYISNLERDLQSQNKYIQGKDEVQKRQQEYIYNLERDLESQNEYIEIIKYNYQDDIDKLEKSITSQNEYIKTVEMAIKQVTDDLEKSKKEKNNLQMHINNKKQELAELEHKNISYKGHIHDLEEILSIQNQHVINLEDEIEKYINSHRRN